MNKARRAELDKAEALLDEARSIVAACAEEEREAFDNLSEGLQASEKGEAIDAAATALEDADDQFDEIVSAINAARDGA